MHTSSSQHGREAPTDAQAPTILALETSTVACSVALSVAGSVSVDHRIAPRQHNQLVLSMIDVLMRAAGVEPRDLDAVAFGRGPGSFTGVRIAAGVAQGISLGAGIPVVPVSTLRVLALTAGTARMTPCNVLATITARADEVYFGGYRCDGDACSSLIDDTVARSAELTLPTAIDANWYVVGDGVRHFETVLAQQHLTCRTDAAVVPTASALLRLAVAELQYGRGVDAAHALPVYLDGTRPWRKLVG
jgi:tRNA threonylcarbamoyladenosine biosynthesis protein TsaB